MSIRIGNQIISGCAGAVNYDNISNCLTKIPQDIKLELDNGLLTLKAGSKVYVPNGFEEDNTTRKFDVVVTEEDLIVATNPYDVLTLCMYDAENNDANARIYMNQCYSGDTEPTDLVSQNKYYWYDTANNIIKTKFGSESTWTGKMSLPFGLVQSTASDGYSYIDQIFNGAGFIGDTTFVLPGVQALFADGRNEDGTLKNKLVTEKKVIINRQPSASTLIGGLQYENDSNFYIGAWGSDYIVSDTKPTTSNFIWYNTKENKVYRTAEGELKQLYWIKCADYVKDVNAIISKFNFYGQSFQAVDYSATRVLVASMFPRAGNNYTWYRLYADGWVEQGGLAWAAGGGWSYVTIPIEMANTKATVNVSVNWATTAQDGLKIPTYYMPSTTQIGILMHGRTGQSGVGYYSGEMSWQVSGMAA